MAHFTELEAFRRTVRRQVYVGMGGLTIVALVALGVALVAFARPIPVVVLDGKGQPVLFEDTVTPRQTMTHVRVTAFAERFLTTFSAIDSTTVDEDATDAANMMTPRLRKIFLADAEEMAKRKNYATLNLKARFVELDLTVAPYRETDAAADIYVTGQGQLVFRPKLGGLEDDPTQIETMYYYAQLKLARVPVTRQTVFGLSVDYVRTRLFEHKEDFEVFVLQEQGP